MPQTKEQRREQSKLLMRRKRNGESLDAAGIVRSPVSGILQPRETMVLTALAEGKDVSKALTTAGFNRTSRYMRDRLKDGGDLQTAYRTLLESKGLTPERKLTVLAAGLDATAPGKVNGEDGKPREYPKWDARLKAVELLNDDLDRAGMQPQLQDSGSGNQVVAVSITINQATPLDVVVDGPRNLTIDVTP